jgi:pilus assembly protein CpaB
MKQRRAILFFTFAAVFGVAAILLVQRLVEPQVTAGAPVVVTTVPIVVATVDVPTGTALSGRQLEVVEWPAKFTPKSYFSSIEEAEDRVVRRSIGAGEPIIESILMAPGSKAGLVSIIEGERRAVSVKVDPVIGVAGFVNPGARVDVLATLRRIDLKDKLPYSKVILQDVPVLAIDQKLTESRDGEPELVSVVTLEVGPEDSERLVYSAHEGRLHLALRSPGDREVVKTASIGVADLLRRERRVAHASPRTRVEVLLGSEKKVQHF